MGLMDILNGMQNGPRGQQNPSSGGGGMSPITMAILGLLAYKAVKSFGGSQPSPNAASPGAAPGSSGGLGDLLNSGLGGLLGGGAAGSVLSGGLNDLLKQFQQSGHSDTAHSWVGTGPNKAISPDDLGNALGADKIDALMTQSGMSRDELLQGLSEHLPDVVNQLTPEGRLPSEQEAARLV
jgi:uncharacterized protein YidB (DUF937 family)